MAYQPKSYKKFVATAATATLVATAVVPAAFADEATTAAFTDVPASYDAAVSFLVENNFAVGLSETQFGISAQITRGDAAVVIAKAAGLMDEDAKASGFTDVPARGAIAVNSLKAAGVVNGTSTTKFGWDQPIKRGDAAIMFAKAFGLTEGSASDVDFTDVPDRYKEAVAALLANDVTNGINATQYGTDNNIKRGDFAKFVYALKDRIELPSTDPAVASVSAINAKEVQVKFSTPIKEASVIASGDLKTGVLEINNQEGNTFTSSASLSADGKTLTLVANDAIEGETVANTTWSGSYAIETAADTIETLAGDFLPVYRDFFTASDSVRPTIVGTSFVDKFTYDVTFSEPVASTGTISYAYADGTATAITATPVLSEDGKSVRVSFDSATLANKAINISFPSLTDFANNIAVPTKASVTISDADNVLPTVSSVATTGYNGTNTSFQIKLSEAVKGSSITGITVNGAAVTASVDANDKTVINATVAGKVQGNALVYIPAGTFSDLNNNLNAETGKFYNFVQDATAPALSTQSTTRIEGVEYLVLTFNENVTVNAPSSVVFTSTDQYGMPATTTDATPVVEAHNVVDGKTKQVRVSLDSLENNKQYKVSFAAGLVTDAYDNDSAALTDVPFSTTTVDTGVGTTNVATIGATPATPGKVEVSFTKPVNVASAQNVANYTVEGATVTAAKVLTNSASGATVELTLADGTVEETGNYNVTVRPITTFNSQDSANAQKTSSVRLLENVRPVLSSTVVTSLTTDSLSVKLTYNDATVVPGSGLDYELFVNGTTTGETINASVLTPAVNGQLQLTWTDADSDVVDLTSATSITLVPVSTFDIADSTGNKAVASTITVK